jgi:hypothetical protein
MTDAAILNRNFNVVVSKGTGIVFERLQRTVRRCRGPAFDSHVSAPTAVGEMKSIERHAMPR